MARLTRNQKIASLINTCMVSQMMQAKAPEGDKTFLRSEFMATVELADKYGIELPSLPIARRFMQAEAALSDR